MAGALHRAGLVGDAGKRAARQRRAQRTGAEQLRRLRAPERGAVECRRDAAVFGALQRVAQRHREQSAAVLAPGLVDQPCKLGRAEAGARGVVHEHAVVVLDAPGDRAESVAHGLRARSAADRKELDPRRVGTDRRPPRVGRGDDDEDALDARLGQHRVDRVFEHRLVAERQVLLRTAVGSHAGAHARRGDESEETNGVRQRGSRPGWRRKCFV